MEKHKSRNDLLHLAPAKTHGWRGCWSFSWSNAGAAAFVLLVHPVRIVEILPLYWLFRSSAGDTFRHLQLPSNLSGSLKTDVGPSVDCCSENIENKSGAEWHFSKSWSVLTSGPLWSELFKAAGDTTELLFFWNVENRGLQWKCCLGASGNLEGNDCEDKKNFAHAFDWILLSLWMVNRKHCLANVCVNVIITHYKCSHL